MSDNLALWNTVSKTNPANTKKVNQRGGFTAIAAHSQIMEATRQFGPIGIGWGYESSPPMLFDGLLTVCVTLWHGSRENRFGPIPGAAELHSSNGKIDHDAPKKAMTDAITKGLSHLGFNADVFLGLFDDSKYVEQIKAEFATAANDTPQDEPQPRQKLEGKHSSKTALAAALRSYGLKVGLAGSTKELDAIIEEYAEDLKQGERYLPKWIAGDPAQDSKGITRLTEERRVFLELLDRMRQNQTKKALSSWLGAYEEEITALNDGQGREFEKALAKFEVGLNQVATINAG